MSQVFHQKLKIKTTKVRKEDFLPLIYTNSLNRSNFCRPTKKDRKISIFPSDFVQSDLILAVRVNRGLLVDIDKECDN
jgi:hypothetical protein